MKKAVVTGQYELDVKHLYVGHAIDIKCPNCKCDIDFSVLSYPTLNKVENIGGYCGGCDREVVLPVKLSMTIEYGEAKIIG